MKAFHLVVFQKSRPHYHPYLLPPEGREWSAVRIATMRAFWGKGRVDEEEREVKLRKSSLEGFGGKKRGIQGALRAHNVRRTELLLR
jgi:hypothetical protein